MIPSSMSHNLESPGKSLCEGVFMLGCPEDCLRLVYVGRASPLWMLPVSSQGSGDPEMYEWGY